MKLDESREESKLASERADCVGVGDGSSGKRDAVGCEVQTAEESRLSKEMTAKTIQVLRRRRRLSLGWRSRLSRIMKGRVDGKRRWVSAGYEV